jgi:hypothetical protein
MDEINNNNNNNNTYTLMSFKSTLGSERFLQTT